MTSQTLPLIAPLIVPLDESREYYFHEGCHILELLNTADDPALSIARARVEAGVTTRWHALQGVTERYVILAGEGVVEVSDLPPQRVKAGDVVVIPPMCRQRIGNETATDLVFLAICSPRFTPDCYQAIE